MNRDLLRHVRCVNSGCELKLYDAHGTVAPFDKSRLAYEFTDAHGAVIFSGDDYGCAPSHSIDSDAALLALLGFLTLRPGDTDKDYFAKYTEAQMAWCESHECESLACNVSVAEEAGGCACDYVWTNLDGWTCDAEERGNVADFEVIDHGEDGSQYFPGCGSIPSKFDHVTTGVGDTGAEALEDALNSMAEHEPSAHPSKLQKVQMRQSLRNPDKSAFESLDHSECGEDHENDDWNHYVSIRYNVRES